MTSWTVRPLTDPTGFDGKRTASPFTVSWSTALDLLDRELKELKATNVVLELDVTPTQIRLDGQLKGGMRPGSGRVRMAFGSKHGPITYATGRFVRAPGKKGMGEDYMHNVYATAKVLEGLRMMDRYGVNAGQQYSAFRELGAGTAMPAGLTAEAAAKVFASYSSVPWEIVYADTDGTARKRAYRQAASNAHPDTGGTMDAWSRVEAAARTLGVLK